MKSGKFVYQSSPSFSLVALLFLIDDTKVRQFCSPAKGKKSILLKNKKAILIAKMKRESKKCAI
jgi:hypothetical protein